MENQWNIYIMYQKNTPRFVTPSEPGEYVRFSTCLAGRNLLMGPPPVPRAMCYSSWVKRHQKTQGAQHGGAPATRSSKPPSRAMAHLRKASKSNMKTSTFGNPTQKNNIKIDQNCLVERENQCWVFVKTVLRKLNGRLRPEKTTLA